MEYDSRYVIVRALTLVICQLEIELEKPLRFWAGQYVDLTVQEKGITRAFSMASAPNSRTTLPFIIKKYPDGAFSSLLDGDLKPGDRLIAKGPYGTCFRREERSGPMILVGGGSGMSPLWSILADHIESGEQRPIRFFYGARTRSDLFLLDELATISSKLPDFKFIPALSHAQPSDEWQGATGLIHEAVSRHLRDEQLAGEMYSYSCRPPQMIYAVLPILQMAGVEQDRI